MLILYTGGKNVHCGTNATCTCIKHKTFTYANCSRRGLEIAPNFTKEVSQIDLGFNLIDQFPSNLPSRLTLLNLTGNPNLRKIEKPNLRRYIRLRYLVVSYCNLRQIDAGTLVKNLQLQHLDISNNPELTLSVLKNVTFDLQHSKIKTLLVDKLQCTYGLTENLPYEYLKYLTNTSLQTLSLASNRLAFLDFKLFRAFPKSLTHLNIGDNNLSFGLYIFGFNSMKGVRSVNASFQASFHLQETINYNCNDSKPIDRFSPTVYNKWKYAASKRNHLNGQYWSQDNELMTNANSVKYGTYIIIYIPPKLEKVYFHDNMFKLELSRYDFNVTNGKLTHLYLQNNIFYKLNGPLRGLQSVKYIDLSNNLCTFISTKFFEELDGIIQLNLSRNLLDSCIADDNGGEIFRKICNIEVLDLSYNTISYLPKFIFKNMVNLTELYLQYNSLETFNIIISHMRNLSFLDLSNNQISTLDMAMRASLDKLCEMETHIEINLVRNPLRCTCENLEFLEWMVASEVSFQRQSNYKCALVNSTIVPLKDLKEIITSMTYACETYLALIVSLTLALFIIVSIIVGAILNRYRWRLRYLYYLVKRRYTEVQHAEIQFNEMFKYDAFVSYAEEDSHFIFRKLDFLEKENNLNLCLHSRDFIPGTNIADNVANAIHNSRRTLCLLTSNFLNSYWCMYELNMARMESIYSREDDNVLCLVILDKNVVKNAPLKIIDLFENQSYLEYPENETDDSPFWDRLCDTLHLPTLR